MHSLRQTKKRRDRRKRTPRIVQWPRLSLSLKTGRRSSWTIISSISLVRPLHHLPCLLPRLCTFAVEAHPYFWSLCIDYEYGRLLACKGNIEGAKHQFELVLSGKHLEVNAAGKKGKYSLEVRSSLYFLPTCIFPCPIGDES